MLHQFDKVKMQESSRPGESHPQALTEPYVRLSSHTALHVPHKLPSLHKLLVSSHYWLTINFILGHVSPFAPFPLQKTSSLLRADSAPVLRIGTLILMGPPLGFSPLSSERQVPTFHTRA